MVVVSYTVVILYCDVILITCIRAPYPFVHNNPRFLTNNYIYLFLDHNISKHVIAFSSQTLCRRYVSFLVTVNLSDFHIYRPEFFLSPAKKLFLGQAKLAYDSWHFMSLRFTVWWNFTLAKAIMNIYYFIISEFM